MPAVHSPKTIETLRQMGCDTTGWALPPVEWRIERRLVPTTTTCPTCHGRGQVADEAVRATAADAPTPAAQRDRAHAMRACPTCPRRRNWPDYGSGKLTQLVERDVEVGYLLWPEGVRFDSRFAGGHRCDLCSKPITNAVPVLATDAAGHAHGMLVGEDCAKTLLGVALDGIPLAAASDAADARAARERTDRQQAALWREVKPKTPPKPPKPTLVCTLDSARLTAILSEVFGPDVLPLRGQRGDGARLEVTRAQASFTVLLQRPSGERFLLEIKQTLTGGLTIHEPYSDRKPFAKDTKATEADALLRTALPKIAAAYGLPSPPSV
jgi:hypothetical protein